MFKGLPAEVVLTKFWKSRCMPKLKVFCWLLVNNRLNTKDLMLRKHWQVEDGPHCVLCNQNILEDVDHLFFSSSFAMECWLKLGFSWALLRNRRDRIAEVTASANQPHFEIAFACAAWNIWKSRNDFIFNGVQPSFEGWRRKAKQDFLLHQFKVKSRTVQALLDSADLLFGA